MSLIILRGGCRIIVLTLLHNFQKKTRLCLRYWVFTASRHEYIITKLTTVKLQHDIASGSLS